MLSNTTKPHNFSWKPTMVRDSGIFLCIFVLAAGILYSDESNMVRVAVLTGAPTVTLSIRGKYKIVNPETNKELVNGRRLQKSKVTITSNEIIIAGQRYAVDRLRIIARKDVSIFVEEKRLRYRGQIDIIRDKNNQLLVVNTLDMESYVKGVLYHEVPHYWPLTAIKAQAVATRTYALYQLSMRTQKLYDVTSDKYSQVYGGRSAERYRSNIAGNRTRGEVLTFKGKVLPAYFHSTCGGQTENVSELWKHDLLPLKGIQCQFCVGSAHYRWKKNFRLKDIQDQLNAHGYKLGLIESIKTMTRTESGRVKTLLITTRDGKSMQISGPRLREIIGSNTIKSNHYDIDMKGYYFDLVGRGWGHGVGMCQWGVYQMSKKRYKYTSILEHYYPGAKIVDIEELWSPTPLRMGRAYDPSSLQNFRLGASPGSSTLSRKGRTSAETTMGLLQFPGVGG